VIAGVCGGLGRYFNFDPVLFRIAFLVLLIPGGLGLLLYIIAWIAIPEFRSADDERRDSTRQPVAGGMAGAIVGGSLIVLGGLILLQQIIPWFDIRIVGALLLIALGAVIVIRGMQSD
jgi:phage shock protein C